MKPLYKEGFTKPIYGGALHTYIGALHIQRGFSEPLYRGVLAKLLGAS